MTARRIALIALVAVIAFGLVGCSTAARAERKGKAAGDEICHAKNASNANDAQRHLAKANNKLSDLARFTGRDVHEDVNDLSRNLNQLSNGHGTNQDISAIVSSIQEARKSAHGNAAAAYDGILEALANCD
jgi:hypothetical protein